jgi:hypothetical protein
MSRTELGVITCSLGTIKQACPQEMLNTSPACELEHSNAPIYLGFLTDGKAVGIDECEVNILKRFT